MFLLSKIYRFPICSQQINKSLQIGQFDSNYLLLLEEGLKKKIRIIKTFLNVIFQH